MPLLGGKKKPKKQSRKKQLKDAFDIQLNPTARDRAAAAKDAAQDALIARVKREKKTAAARQVLVEKAEAIKEAADKREEERKAAAKRAASAAAQAKRGTEPEQRTACTCRKPRLDRQGKCTRCHKKPASRRRGPFG
jgi:hypothetical protein